MSSKIRLRVLGTSVTLIEEIRLQAEHDLGIELEYIVCDPQTAQRTAVLYPEKYDIYDQWFHNIDFVWPVRSIQPIDTEKIKYWGEINELPKKGRLIPDQPIAPGGVPSKRLYIQPDDSLSDIESRYITMLPLTHNVDSFIYFPKFLPIQLTDKPESWSWLLEDWQGRVAIQNDAAIGALDLAMALQSIGKIQFNDMGNLSLDEIDKMTECLLAYKNNQQFSDFWVDDKQAFELISNKNIYIGSLWYATVIQLIKQKQTIDFKIAKPVEGYRAWYGGLALSCNVDGKTKAAAYDYLNWWLCGWAGAMVAKQGLYISNPLRSREYLSNAEWDFWYMGKPASEDLKAIDQQILIPKGHSRFGGSYIERMGHIGIWNTVMDEHNYLVRKWRGLTV